MLNGRSRIFVYTARKNVFILYVIKTTEIWYRLVRVCPTSLYQILLKFHSLSPHLKKLSPHLKKLSPHLKKYIVIEKQMIFLKIYR
jgi:hypothetical protein